MIRFVFITIICLAASVSAFAQNSPVPENYQLKDKEDFPKYEQDLINTINWLEQTPWDSHKEERKAADTFVMTWLNKSPTITLVLTSNILLDISDKNPELLTSFMAGYLKYALQNKDKKNDYDINKAYTAGVQSIIVKYRNEPRHNKDRNVEYLAKMHDSGKLEKWVQNNFNTTY